MLDAYTQQTWHTSAYVAKDIDYPKHRQVNKLPVIDHVIQHAALQPVEDNLRKTLYSHSPAGSKGKGTHYFYNLVKRDIFNSPQQDTFYCLPMDIHHYFQSIDHALLKSEYRRKIKDPSSSPSSTRWSIASIQASCSASSSPNSWVSSSSPASITGHSDASTFSKTPTSSVTGRLAT